jgi:hypothetical protein
MMNMKLGAGAARAGAASRYGSGSATLLVSYETGATSEPLLREKIQKSGSVPKTF